MTRPEAATTREATEEGAAGSPPHGGARVAVWTAVITFLATLVVAGLVAIGVARSGLVDVAATAPSLPGVPWLMETTRDHSVARHARGIVAPADIDDPARRQRGLVHYAHMCAGCHGAPGVKESPVGQGLEPPPPELARGHPGRAHPERTFWVVKHGIRMTGMPAFGKTHSDAEVWDLVAFLRELPTLSAQDYARQVQQLKAQPDAD